MCVLTSADIQTLHACTPCSCRYWSLAKKLLKDYAEQAERSEHKLANCAAVAAVFEYAARQEMGLGSTSSTDSSTPDGSAAVGAAVPAVSGLHGSFLAAGRLLREALDMYKKAGRWSECWRLLRDYTGLKPLLKTQEIDGITLVGLFGSSCYVVWWSGVHACGASVVPVGAINCCLATEGIARCSNVAAQQPDIAGWHHAQVCFVSPLYPL